ncbi:MAG: hypothetical protein RR317_05800 [Bilophila sp.]
MPLSISGLNTHNSFTGVMEQLRTRQHETAPTVTPSADTATVSTNLSAQLSDTDAATLMSGLQNTLSSQRVNALSAHSGLDYTRAMKLLEGLD